MRFQPITQQQFLVTIEGINAYFETFSGLQDGAETSEYTDGFSRLRRQLVGPRSIETVTLGKPFVPEEDALIVQFWKNFTVGREITDRSAGTEITVQPVNYTPEPTAIGDPYVLYGAIPNRIEFLQADKKSQDISTLVLSFSVQDWSLG